MEKVKEVERTAWQKVLDRAYRMGKDCARKGANETNCHFTLFVSHESTKAWEQGKRDMIAQLEQADGKRG